MKLLLTLIMSITAALAQVQSSFAVLPAAPPNPINKTIPADLSGSYLIVNVHSGQALGSQAIGRMRFAAQFENASGSWEFIPAESAPGLYRIRSPHGYLQEEAGAELVGLGETGTEWYVGLIEGGDAYQIRGKSGRLMESLNWRALSGSWAVMMLETGGSNQEWRLAAPSAVYAPTRSVYVRGPNGHILSGAAAGAKTIPGVTWATADGRYTYHVRANEPEVTWIWLGRGTGYDSSEVSTPQGWHFGMRGWFADKQGVSGEFVLSSSWAPGPVILQAVISEGPFEYGPEVTASQHDAMAMAYINRGSHSWAIGPAIPPGLDANAMRKLARRWVSSGLAFVAPLLDESKELSVAVDELHPRSTFEKDLVAVLRLAIADLR